MVTFTIKDSQEIKLLIAKTGNNLKGFSEEIGVSYPYLSRIITGKKSPSAKVAGKIAKGLDKEINELFLVFNKKE